MKIYYQYSKCKTLIANGGDYVNEIGVCKALSQFAEVYYAGKLFQPDKPDFGLNTKDIISHKDCNVIVSRANSSLINNAGGVPSIICAVPYKPDVFKKATLIYTLSRSWGDLLRKGIKFPGINPDGVIHNNVISLGQVVDDIFKPYKTHPDIDKIRNEINADIIIGMFGRITKSTSPALILSIFKDIQNNFPKLKIKLMIGTKTPFDVKDDNIVIKHFTWNEMPFVYNACDIIMTNTRTPGFNYSGSIRVIEASRCGVPIIMQEAKARKEITGNYIGYIPFGTLDQVNDTNRKILLDKFISFIGDKKLRVEAGNHLYNTSKSCTIEEKGKEYYKIFKRFK